MFRISKPVCVALAAIIMVGTAFADEKADIEAVEQEIRAEEDAAKIYKRAPRIGP